jgi:DNA-binding transcriptional LysR family regulator
VEYRHLKFFVAVAEELHFTRASLRLCIAQPHLSQEIRRLEREIGVELFVRTKRSVALTSAGHAFLERVRILLDYTADAVHAAQRASRGEIGRLRLGFVRVAAIGVIPNAIARFRSAYPDVEVLLNDVSSDEGLDAVRIGQLDLCVLHPPRIVDPAVKIETIWLEPLVALLPPKHQLADMQRISLHRLRSEPWVIHHRETASRLYDEIIAACAAVGFAPRVAQRTARMTTTISMVASGIGVALMPITQARLAFGGAVYRQLRPPGSSIPVAFAWQQDQTARALAHFMTVVRESLPRKSKTNAPLLLS